MRRCPAPFPVWIGRNYEHRRHDKQRQQRIGHKLSTHGVEYRRAKQKHNPENAAAIDCDRLSHQ